LRQNPIQNEHITWGTPTANRANSEIAAIRWVIVGDMRLFRAKERQRAEYLEAEKGTFLHITTGLSTRVATYGLVDFYR